MDTSKIIRGVVSNGRYTVTAPIVKEDYGLYLQIEGVELPPTYQVDFSNSESNGTSVTMIGNADGVLIPRQFIDSGKDVFAFLYHVGEDYGRTVFKFRIPNKLRPDRTDEQPTPAEQSTIDQLIGALNSAVEQTGEDVESAEQAKDDAESARDNAQTYANNAQSSAQASARNAESASQSASQASASATASAQSASQSAQIKADVEDLAEDAQGYANSAQQSASQASASEQGCARAVLDAASAAAIARARAEEANGYAQTASAKAQDASQSASTASQKATESAQSASQAQAYKTDAESAKTASQTAQGLAESARDSAISAKTDAEQAKADAESARDEAVQAVASISGALDDKADVITDTASGSIASFSDGADNLPLKSLVVDINPVQDLHGQESPYPAGSGANKWDEQWETGWIGWSGQDADNPDRIRSKGFIPVSEGSVYRVVTSNNLQFFYYDSNKSLVSYESSSRADQSTITIPTGCAYIRFYTYGTSYGGTYKNDIAINYPSTVTTYSPYSNICPISGWTQVGVEQSGENVGRIYAYSANGLLTPQTTPVVSNSYGTTISTTDSQANKIVVTQTRHDGATYGSYLNGFFVVGIGNIINGQRYYFRAKINVTSNPLNTERLLAFWNGSGNSTPLTIANGYVTGTFVASISDEQRYLEIRCAGASFEMSEIMFMLAKDMPSPYSPYTGRSITIDLGQTVYGGYLDAVSGVLTVDRAMRVFDGTENGWQWYEGYKQASISLTESAKYNASELTYICNVLNPVANPSRPTNIGNFASLISSGASAAFSAPSNTLDEFKAFAQANPIQFCYELATPIEIQLSANQINSLYGANNIWADSGDTEVVYRADTKLFIERLTAPDSADMIADSNIVSGQYFMVGNNLFKATANIANGASIIVGTNCIRKSLSEALNEINA